MLGALVAPVSVAVGAPSVALPSISSALGVSFAATEWIISVWSLGSAVAMPLGGYFAQRWGLRTTLGFSVVAIAAGSILAAAAPALANLASPAVRPYNDFLSSAFSVSVQSYKSTSDGTA